MLTQSRLSKTAAFISRAVRRQHTIIRVPFDEDVCRADGWYLRHTWTPAQKHRYREWFVRNLMKTLKYTKKEAERQFSWWDLSYGWKEAPDGAA